MPEGSPSPSMLSEALQQEAHQLGAALILVATPRRDLWRVLGASEPTLSEHPDPIHLWSRPGAAGAPGAGRPPAMVCSLLGRRPVHTWVSPPSTPGGAVVAVYWAESTGTRIEDLRSMTARVMAAVAAAPPRAWGEAGPDLLARIKEALPVGLIYFDSGPTRAVANRFARKLLDLPPGDAHPRALAARLEQLSCPTPFPEGVSGAQGTVGDIHVGGRRYAVTSLPVEGLWGKGVVWRIEDVTEARAVQAKLDEAKRNLLLSQVSGGIGHEFNNLLSRVICLAEDIQGERDPAAVRQRAETLIETAERGAQVVRRLMTYAGGALIDVRSVSIALALAEWGDGRNAEDLAVDIDGCTAIVTVDPALFRAVLDELLANARQDGASRIEVSCEKTSDGGALDVIIADDGPGMDAATAARATEPFFTTRPVGAGVGLGLSMVKGALDQWGGRLHIASQVGKGTTIRLTLPTSDTPLAAGS